jgi:hypothetical protein
MTRKEAHQRKNLRLSFYARHNANTWYEDYTPEQMTWLWEHKHIQWSKPMAEFGESEYRKYIEFTNKGRKWHNWYSCSLWQYIKYYVIRVSWWKSQWCKIRIKMGHHYAWQEYSDLDLNEI